jgi:hypothetical protein
LEVSTGASETTAIFGEMARLRASHGVEIGPEVPLKVHPLGTRYYATAVAE